jgi:DNA-binding helix-hairpin-helix protein with protein kinase domain
LKNLRANLANRPTAVQWLIAFCLLLVLLSTAVQALHIDSRATEDLKDCPFCQVATATAIAILVVLLYAVYRTAVFINLSEDTEAIASFDIFTLFSRPPPLA